MSMKQALDLENMEHITGGAEDPIIRMTVCWEDGNGKKYSYTVNNEQPKTYDPIISQTVTWEDENGNTYSNTYAN